MAHYDDLEEKAVLVNGGTKGIGLEIVLEFLRNHCKVTFTGRTLPENFQKLNEIRQKYGEKNVSYYVVDSSDHDSVKIFMDCLKKRANTFSVLVNNAAQNFYSEITDQDYGIARQLVNTNFFGYLNFITEITPFMSKKGSIINMSSIVAYRAFKGRGIYAATKSAIDSLTRSAALELSQKGIRVNSVCAGTVYTDMVQKTLDQSGDPFAESAKLISRIPMGRFGTPTDIANVVKFLASDDSDYITGASIFVDGGVGAGFM